MTDDEFVCVTCGHSKTHHIEPFDMCQFEVAPNRVCGCTQWMFER